MFQVLRNTFQLKAFRDVSVVYIGSFVNNVALFATNLVLARSTSQEAFGMFGLALLVLGAVTDLSDFGLNAAFLRFASYYYAQHEESKLKVLVKLMWRWRLFLTLCITLGGLLLSGVLARHLYHEEALTPYFQLAFLGVGGVILSAAISVYLQATQRFLAAARVNAIKGTLRFVFVAGLVFCGVLDLRLLLLAYITVPWLVTLGTLPQLPKGFSRTIIPSEEVAIMRQKLFSFSVWVMIWSFLIIIASRVDQTLISRYLSVKDVAIYSAGMQLIVFYTYMLQSLTTVLAPKMSAKATVLEMQTLLKAMYRKIIPLVICLALFIYPSKVFLPLLFGPEYAASMNVYVILSYSILLNFLALPWSLMISALNATKVLAIGGVLQLAITIGANMVLIPQFGVIGASFSFFGTVFLMNVYTVVAAEYVRRRKTLVTL